MTEEASRGVRRPLFPEMGDDGGVTETERQRRRRLAEIFGEVLPQTTSDERSEGPDRREGDQRETDRWYRENRPPHHGG
ncbi:hypothetical protein GCM10027271_16600 [Saccharopolyspora gloriosae]